VHPTTQESYNRAKLLLQTHSREHIRLAEALLEHEVLDADQIALIMNVSVRLVHQSLMYCTGKVVANGEQTADTKIETR
jgi:transcription initiation factor IIE alpha subunit